MRLINTLRTLNPEWLRQPFSRLEATLRLPSLVRDVLTLFIIRVFPLWLTAGYLIGHFTHWTLGLLVGLFVTVAIELFILRRWYFRRALPDHLRNLGLVKVSFAKHANLPTPQLVKTIESSVRLTSRGLINIGYVGLAAWGWEIIFRWLYPLIARPTNIPYSDLLIGFPNKSIEADQALWKVAQLNGARRAAQLNTYLEEFGSRVEDVELANPTLREQPELVDHLLKLYSRTPNPAYSFKQSVTKREQATQQVERQLRVPRTLFHHLLNIVQANVRLREDRRYYEFLGDYYLRQMILTLGKKLNLTDSTFTHSWQELKHAAN